MTKKNEELSNNFTDNFVATAKAVVSLCPVIGGILGELIGTTIPRQRLDRVIDYLKRLDAKVATSGIKDAEARLKEAPFVDLFEDSMLSACRGATSERIQYIASLVGNSLSPEHLDATKHQRLLWMLAQLNDAEIIILNSFAFDGHGTDINRDKYIELHKDLLNPPVAHYGLIGEAFRKVEEAQDVYYAYCAHLIQLHLIRPEFSEPVNNRLPERDENTGLPEPYAHRLTSLGLALLCQIDLLPQP